VGQTQDFSLEVVDPSADRNLTVQQLIDFVKRDFSKSPFFSETIPSWISPEFVKYSGPPKKFFPGNDEDFVKIATPSIFPHCQKAVRKAFILQKNNLQKQL
jgi:hypothetical protein